MAIIYANSALLVASFFFLFFATLTVCSLSRSSLAAREQLRTFVYAFMGIVVFSLVTGATLLHSLSQEIIFRFLVFTCSLCLLLLVAAFALNRCVEMIADLEKENDRSIIDPLTGLYNRYYIERRLESEVGRSKRYSSPLAVVAIEITDFHLHSNVYGFQSAERLMQKAASTISSSVRDSDIVARYNTTHFIVALVATPESCIGKVTSRLRENLRKNLRDNLVLGLDVSNEDAKDMHGNVKFGKVWCNLYTVSGSELICSALEQIQIEKGSKNKQHKLIELGKTDNVKNLEQAA